MALMFEIKSQLLKVAFEIHEVYERNKAGVIGRWCPVCCVGKPKQKVGKAVKTPSLTWMEALPPPPPIGAPEQYDRDSLPEDMDLG